MPVLEVRHLRLVEAIDRLGSLTKAAEGLFLTQSAASHALRDVEQRLGAELFRRQGRGLVITPAGERLARRARSILAELQAAEAEVAGEAEPGCLRLATECYTCYHWLPSILRELQSRFPHLRFELAGSATRQPVQAVLDGQADLGIVFTPASNAALDLVPLFSNEVVAIVAPHHRLAGRACITAEDLRDEHIVIHADRYGSVLIGGLLRPAGIEPVRCSELHLTEAVVETVKAGLGVAALARWAAAPHLEAGTLCALPITASGLFRQWWACYRRMDVHRPGLGDLIRLIRERGLGSARGEVG